MSAEVWAQPGPRSEPNFGARRCFEETQERVPSKSPRICQGRRDSRGRFTLDHARSKFIACRR
ncbi:hypothetical protein B0H19DRAFT_1159304 [Mycena capillaripes]|nr:hypothetical protein B0H19DRAFT_1159304 [Mycena capillaripes]